MTAGGVPEFSAATVADASAGLEAEWRRIEVLLAIVEASRTGGELDEEFLAAFDRAVASVATARATFAWEGLAAVAAPKILDGLGHIDLDVLALVLAPEASPAMATRIHSLQPQIGGPIPSLPLIQELLMLESAEGADRMVSRLSSDAPLVGGGLVKLEGEGAYQVIRPGPGVAHAVLGRSLDFGPPPGTSLDARPADWSELVVPARTRRSLDELIAWLEGRRRVFGDWRVRPLGGPIALFCGSSGTGKTYAARALASRIGWPLYSLDLGRIVSKYIGETEKNLNRLLDALHGRAAILQIDEADSLFGRRGEISDARDRYANLEVSHLLSRLERHDGPVVLTTNLRGNIDAAFLRRFHLVIEFPSPDAAARRELWETLLPPEAPRDEDVDCQLLAEAVNASGGSIHNIAVFAAMLAAGESRPIGLRHIARAAHCELAKENRSVRSTELGFLAEWLDDGEGA